MTEAAGPGPTSEEVRARPAWQNTWRGWLGLWALWVVVTAAGPALGTLIVVLVGLPRWPQIILVLVVSIAGIAVGQWLVLRRLVRIRTWVWWTAGAFAVGVFASFITAVGLVWAMGSQVPSGGPIVTPGECECTFSPPEAMWAADCCQCYPVRLWGDVIAPAAVVALAGAVGGAVAGLLQWTPLRRWAGRNNGWVLTTALSGAVLFSLLPLQIRRYGPSTIYDGDFGHIECHYEVLPGWIGVVAGPVAALLLGALTGIVLVRALAGRAVETAGARASVQGPWLGWLWAALAGIAMCGCAWLALSVVQQIVPQMSFASIVGTQPVPGECVCITRYGPAESASCGCKQLTVDQAVSSATRLAFSGALGGAVLGLFLRRQRRGAKRSGLWIPVGTFAGTVLGAAAGTINARTANVCETGLFSSSFRIEECLYRLPAEWILWGNVMIGVILASLVVAALTSWLARSRSSRTPPGRF